MKMYGLKRLRVAQWKDVCIPDCYFHKCPFVMTADKKHLFSDSKYGQNRNLC